MEIEHLSEDVVAVTLDEQGRQLMSEMSEGNFEEVVFEGIPLILFDTEPSEVRNPLSGESCVLEPVAMALYDFIKGAEMFAEYDLLERGLQAFRKHYPDEYMVLLD